MAAPSLFASTPASKPVIGMVHLPPLPGSPGCAGDLAAVVEHALRDAEALLSGGVHALLLENFGDAPFYPRRVPRHVVACMTAVGLRIRERFDVPLGVNVLRNDGESALAIAQAVGAAFIRVNVLCGARVTDQGIVEGIAHRLLRLRARLGARQIQIFADVNVKHSAPLGQPRPLEDEVADLIRRGGADALVVSGAATGAAADVNELRRVKSAAGNTPVLVGSGVSVENVAAYLPHADGFIVGTSLKVDGVVTNLVDVTRVKALSALVARSEPRA